MTPPPHVEPAPTDPTLRYRLGGRRAWVVWSAAISVYILAVFHRTSLGVAGLVAAERFHISSAELATFTMVQLSVYAAMQVPIGAILDRVGAKKLLVTGVLLMTGGQFAFAFASTFGVGVAARVFVGMGDAMIFISLMQLVALWFPPARTAMITQLTGALGQVGAIAAAAPLSAALHSLGWTRSFAAAAGLGTVALIGIVLDKVAPGGPSTYTVDSFRVAMSVQYIVWVFGLVQILRYRRKARRALRRDQPDLYAATAGG